MEHDNPRYARILAIDPSTRGFGYAVLENTGRLIDWGNAEIGTEGANPFLDRVKKVVDRYSPYLLALEDCTLTRRGDRAQNLINAVVGYAELLEIQTALLSRADVEKSLALLPGCTKHEIATSIARAYPELLPLLPKKRRTWDSEHPRMNLFDAVGLAVAARVRVLRYVDSD